VKIVKQLISSWWVLLGLALAVLALWFGGAQGVDVAAAAAASVRIARGRALESPGGRRGAGGGSLRVASVAPGNEATRRDGHGLQIKQ
jgi:hypothetical protein